MVRAALARVEDKATEVTLDHSLDVALAAADDTDVMALELGASTLAHIAGEHQRDAHRLHHRGDVRLTAAALWRVKTLSANDFAILNIEDGIVCAVSEVVIHLTLARWYSKTHKRNF